MVTKSQVRHGIEQYIDTEILPKLIGARKFGVAVYTELAIEGFENQIDAIMDRPAIKMLNLMDASGMIDIDRMYHVAVRKMNNEKMKFELPLVGTLTLDRNDVEKLYALICNCDP